MKNIVRSIYKHRLLCVAALALTTGASSCTKDVVYEVENEGTIYMAQAYDNEARLNLFVIDTLQDINFGGSYGGIHHPQADIPLEFQVDQSLIASYNQQHGTDFQPFPESSYSISGLQTIIRKGKADSDPLKIVVDAGELEMGTPYMIPVKLISAAGSPINDNLAISYFRIDSLVRRERDVTGQATLAVSHENNGGSGANEGSPKLVDNNTGTKYLTQNYASGMWFQLTFPAAKALGAYTFTSGNDADTRDPKTWRLEASNNGTDWTVLDTRTDIVFSGRTQTRRFEFENTTPYTRYRIVVVANNGATIFQMSEWRMIEFY